MGLSFTQALEEADATTRLQLIEDWARGSKIIKYFVEELEELDLDSIKTSAEEALTNVSDPAERAKNAFLRALYRDGMYALSNRNRLLELGIHNSFRETYEKGKVAVDVDRKALA